MLNFIVSLFRRQKINLAHYPKPKTDYGTLNAAQRNAMNNILATCDEGLKITQVHKLTQAEFECIIPEMSQAEFDGVVTHIGMRFGSEDICKNIALKRRNAAAVNLEIYKKAMEHKVDLDREIDSALSKMFDGSTRFKLWQICWWIARNARYKCPSNNPLDLLDEGGMCGAYSMLFYKMATRLGVKAYICRGQLPFWQGGGPHSWNMVEIDGTKYWYDVTWYDTSGRMPWFLHSKTNWGREYKLNER